MHLLTIFLTIPSKASPQTDEAQNRRKNPKLERRNLKQIRMTRNPNAQNQETFAQNDSSFGLF